MLGTTLDALLTAGFTFEESVHLIQSIIEGRSQASLPPVNGATSTEGSSATWANIPGPVPGPLVTAPGDMHPNPPGLPAVQGTPNFAPTPPAMQTLICGLAGGATCTQPLHGTMTSLQAHIRMHGHKHPGRSSVQCPWMGCLDRLQWDNMPRHIASIHMGIRLKCGRCGKLFTRAKALERHVASNNNEC
ncbi:hypothetical protein PAXINDRAFT_14421 [Paxillus involutus ATCC 200175]|uniref:C2H2-type domain-containing protein n=1 Tax=Paxillus involutus ATCC 200175 TaxID=664439 RepID=A0A0C9TB92_PAXIN|nr:hypothetical protein PAXINDRAFT_14418 [Paxillus involutus ATCC 200175]KIJ12864.1 hypothetical protein PAXINDRAFT_14421 [Paxillus involutus ATCC 200175]